MALKSAEVVRELAEYPLPVDKGQWYMPVHQVNAYYNPAGNEIVFPAGILQPPFFDASYPKAMNLGAIGAVMGHEITHGFDNDGRKFDPQGKMEAWWAEEVAGRFETQAQCLVETGGPRTPDDFSKRKVQRGHAVA